jgi:hypothetical protein
MELNQIDRRNENQIDQKGTVENGNDSSAAAQTSLDSIKRNQPDEDQQQVKKIKLTNIVKLTDSQKETIWDDARIYGIFMIVYRQDSGRGCIGMEN